MNGDREPASVRHRKVFAIAATILLLATGFAVLAQAPEGLVPPTRSHGGAHLEPFSHRSVDFAPPAPRTTPVTTPEYGQPGTGYSGEDLAFDDDARDELYLRDLAEDLNWDPWALYNHVRNSYRCAPYWGSMKGAAGAYWDGEGNDMDLAALLVALLRASNIPARYVQGTIQVTSAQAQEFTGLADARAAFEAFLRNGVPAQASAPVYDPILLEHVWVEAYVDASWRPMDPCWKPVVWNRGAGASVLAGIFDVNAAAGWAANETLNETQMMNRTKYGDNAISFPHFDGPFDSWVNQTRLQDLVTQVLNLSDPQKSPVNVTSQRLQDLTKDNIPFERTDDLIQETELAALGPIVDRFKENVLPRLSIAAEALDASRAFPHFPYLVLAVLATYARVPDADHHQFGLQYGGIDLLAWTSRFAGHRLSLGVVPATAADAQTIARQGIVHSGVGDLQAAPVLYLDGAAIALGGVASLGENLSSLFRFLSPFAAEDAVAYPIPLGATLALGLDLGRVSDRFLEARHERYLRTLQFLQMGLGVHVDEFSAEWYFLMAVYYWMKTDTQLWQDALAAGVLVQRFPSLAVAGILVLQDAGYGYRLRTSVNFLDVVRDAVNVIAPRGDEADRFWFRAVWLNSCTVSEAMKVYGGLTNTISLCEVFEYAVANWIDIVLVTPDNLGVIGELPGAIQDTVTTTVNGGGIAIVPGKPIPTGDGRTATGAFTATGGGGTATGAGGGVTFADSSSGGSSWGPDGTASGLGSSAPPGPGAAGATPSAKDCDKHDPCKGVDLGIFKDILDVTKSLSDGLLKKGLSVGVSKEGADSLKMSVSESGEVSYHGRPSGKMYGGMYDGQHLVTDSKLLKVVKGLGKVAKVLNVVTNGLELVEFLNRAVEAYCKAACGTKAAADAAGALAYGVIRKLLSSLAEAGGSLAGAVILGSICGLGASVVPVLGTAVGALICGVIGGVAGGTAASKIVEYAADTLIQGWLTKKFSDAIQTAQQYYHPDSEFCKEKEKFKDCDKKPGGDGPDDKFDVSSGFIRENSVFKTVMRNAARKGLPDLLLMNTYDDLARGASGYADIDPFRAELARITENASAQYAVIQDRFDQIVDEFVLAPDVAVLDRGFSNPMVALLNEANIPVVGVTTSFPADLAERYPVLVLPSGSLAGLEEDPVFRERLSGYAASGGAVWVMAQQDSTHWAALPGDLQGFGWSEDQSCYYGGSYIAEYTPALAGMTQPTLNINLDGFFFAWPDNATAFIRRTANGQPAGLVYPWGQGRFVATSAYTDWASAHFNLDDDGLKILRDGIAWLLHDDILDLPVDTAGNAVDLLVENTGNSVGARVVVAEVRPDFEIRAYHNFTVALDPGTNATLRIDLDLVPLWEGGLWYLDYAVLDANDALVSQRWDAAVVSVSAYRSNPGGFAYASTALSWAIVVSPEYTVKEGTIVLTLLFWNTEAAPRRVRAHTRFRVGGEQRDWDLTIPAGGNLTQVYSIFLSGYGQNTLFMDVYDTDNANVFLGRAFKTFRFVIPQLQVSAALSGTQFVGGETVFTTYAVLNQIGYSYDATIRMTVTNSRGIVAGTSERNATLPAYASVGGTLNVTLPAAVDPGPHTVSVGVYRGATLFSDARAVFDVPAADLELTPTFPALLTFGAPFPFSCDIANVGTRDVNAGTFQVTLYDGAKSVIARRTQAFSVAAAQVLPVGPLSLDPGPQSFEDYTLHFVASGETGSVAGSVILPNRLPAEVAFSQQEYRITETLAFDLTFTNEGPFDQTLAIDVTVPDVAFTASDAFPLPPGASVTRSFSGIDVPDGLAPGPYPLLVTKVAAVPAVETFLWPVNASKLEVWTNASVYDAGDGLGIRLTNVGGVNSTWDYDVELTDARGTVVFQQATTSPVAVLETLLLNYTVPVNAISGDYLLHVRHRDVREGFYRDTVKELRIRGIVVDLSVDTPADYYYAGDAIAADSTMQNLNEPATNLSYTVALQAHGGQVIGTVRDWATNAPLAAARVSLATPTGLVTALSLPDGSYSLGGVPATGTPQALEVRKYGYQVQAAPVVVPLLGVVTTDFWMNLSAYGNVSGFVNVTGLQSMNGSTYGSGAVGALVTLAPLLVDASYLGDLRTHVSWDGSFSVLRVPEGTYFLEVTWGAAALNDTVVVDFALGLLTYTLPAPPPSVARVAGYVTDAATSAPVLGATVTIGALVAHSDGAGFYFLLSVPLGPATVTVTHAAYTPFSGGLAVIAGVQLFNVSLTDPYPYPYAGFVRLQGNVTAGANPLSDVLVSLVPVSVPGSHYPETRVTRTDVQGAFDITHLAAGSYQVTFNKTGYADVTTTQAFASDLVGWDQVMVWQWTRTATVQGLVLVAGTGAPIAGATVQVGSVTAVTDAAGFYTTGAIPINSLGDHAKPYSVGATAAGYEWAGVFLNVTDGVNSAPTISLTPNTAGMESEPNPDFGNATAMTVNTTTAYYISPAADEDYFRFTTTTPGQVTIDIANVPPNVAMQYSLYNSAYVNILGTWANAGNPITQTMWLQVPGDYYVHIWSWTGGANATDSALVTVTMSSMIVDPEGDNHAYATAQDINVDEVVPSYHGAYYEIDYYQFSTPDWGTILVDISTVPGTLSGQLDVWTASLASLGGNWASSGVPFSYSIYQPAGTYYLRLYNWAGNGDAVPILFQVRFESRNDTLQNVDFATAATLLDDQTRHVGTRSNTDYAFWNVTVPQRGTIVARIHNPVGGQAYQIYLYSGTYTYLTDAWASQNQNVTLQYYTTTVGTYYLRSWAWSGTTSLHYGVSLDLQLFYDPHEANGDALNATVLPFATEDFAYFYGAFVNRWWQFTLPQVSYVRWEITDVPATMAMQVYLYDGNGTYLDYAWVTQGQSLFYTRLLGAGAYSFYLNAWGYSTTLVPARLRVLAEPVGDAYGYNPTVSTATPITAPAELRAVLPGAIPQGTTQEDWYRFEVAARGTFQVNVSQVPAGSTVYVYLYDATGTTWYTYWWFSLGSLGTGSWIGDAGIYHLRVVRSGGPDSGVRLPVVIGLEFLPRPDAFVGNHAFADAALVDFGGSFDGWVDGAYVTDHYWIYVPVAGDLNATIQVADPAFDHLLYLLDGAGGSMGGWWSGGPGQDSTFQVAVTPGYYDVAINPYGDSDYPYRISISLRNTGVDDLDFPGLSSWGTVLANATTVDIVDWLNLTQDLGALCLDGGMRVYAALYNEFGQFVADAWAPVACSDEPYVLLVTADREVYRYGSNATVRVLAALRPGVDPTTVPPMPVTVYRNGRLLHSGLVDFRNGTYDVNFTVPVNNSFELLGTFGNLTVASQHLARKAGLQVTVTYPQQVGRAPFEVPVKLTNTGDMDLVLFVESMGVAQKVRVPSGESRTVTPVARLTANGTVYVNVTGDLSFASSGFVAMGERVLVDVEAHTAYVQGFVVVPYRVTNVGWMDSAFDLVFLLDGNATVIPIRVGVGQEVRGEVRYTVAPGPHTFTYVCPFCTQVFLWEVVPDPFVIGVVEAPTATPGTVLLNVSVERLDPMDFTGALRVTSDFFFAEFGFNASYRDNLTFAVPVPVAAAPLGPHAFAVEVRGGGKVVTAKAFTYVVTRAVFAAVPVDLQAAYDVGQNVTVTFNVTNAGNAEELASLHFVVPGIVDTIVSDSVPPGETRQLAVIFLIPEDLDARNATASWSLGASAGSAEFAVSGARLTVSAALDRPAYRVGEQATLTLTVLNLNNAGYALFSRVQMATWDARQDFTLPALGTQTLTFVIPLEFTGEKLFYSVYFASGRSIHINSLFVVEDASAVTGARVTADKQVYFSGETVQLTISPDTGRSGAAVVEFEATREERNLTAAGTFLVPLPAAIVSGTYRITYWFDGNPGLYEFDVMGYDAKVKSASLDRAAYALGDAATLTVDVLANELAPGSAVPPLNATLSVLVLGPDGHAASFADAPFVFSKGRWPQSVTFDVLGAGPGTYTVLYDISLLAGPNATLLVTSGSVNLHVQGAALVTLSTEKEVYGTDEAVDVLGSTYDAAGASLAIFVDGAPRDVRAITAAGLGTTRFALPPLSEGDHEIAAELTAGNLTTRRTALIKVVGGRTASTNPIVDVGALRFSPDPPRAGESVIVTVPLTNLGTTNLTNVTVSLVVDGVVVGTQVVDIPGTTTIEVTFTWVPSTGSHRITVRITHPMASTEESTDVEVTGGSGLNPVVVVLGVFLALLLLYFFVRLRRGRPTKEEEAATGEAKPSEASAEKPPEGTPEKTSETAKGDQAAVAAAPAFKAKRTRAVALASPPAETKPEAQTEAKAEPAASVATCIICGKGAAEAEVIECGKCDKPMHERCGDTVPMCPNCGAKFA